MHDNIGLLRLGVFPRGHHGGGLCDFAGGAEVEGLLLLLLGRGSGGACLRAAGGGGHGCVCVWGGGSGVLVGLSMAGWGGEVCEISVIWWFCNSLLESLVVVQEAEKYE